MNICTSKKRKASGRDDSLQSYTTEFVTESYVNEETLAITWTICDFSKCEAAKEIRSRNFFSRDGAEWYISVKLKTIDEVECVSIFLYLDNAKEAGDQNAYYSFSIFGSPNDCVLKAGKYRSFTATDSGWGWKNAILQSDLKDLSKNYIVEDSVTIKCEVKILGPVQNRTIAIRQQQNGVHSSVGIEKHLENMENLLKTGADSDIKIATATKVFPAHKAILKSRSPVFKRMFETEMQESENGIVNIEDLGEDAVMEMLTYIYTGKSINLETNAIEVMNIAEKYAIVDLKENCEAVLIQRLNITNAVEYAKLADLFNAWRLKSVTERFISDNLARITKIEELKKAAELQQHQQNLAQ